MYGIPCHVYSVWIIAKVSWTAAKLISQFYNYRQLFLYPLLSLLSLSLPIIIIFFKLSPIICVLSLFLLIVLFLWIIYCHFFAFYLLCGFLFFYVFFSSFSVMDRNENATAILSFCYCCHYTTFAFFFSALLIGTYDFLLDILSAIFVCVMYIKRCYLWTFL